MTRGIIILSSDGEFPTMQEVRDAHYHKAIERVGGSVSKAAKLLGIGRASLYRWVAVTETLVRDVQDD